MAQTGLIAGVKPFELPGVWPRVESWVRLALVRGGWSHLYSMEDLYKSILGKQRQLWIGFDPASGQIDCFAITEVLIFPKARVLQIFALGGENFKKVKTSGWELMEEFGRSNGCSYIQFGGRLGWQKEMKAKGMKVTANYSFDLEN